MTNKKDPSEEGSKNFAGDNNTIPPNDDLREQIKAWYKKLPEITLPNQNSEDGTVMELNVVDLVRFIAQDRQRLLDKLLAELPEKRNAKELIYLKNRHEAHGFNQALDQCRQIIEKQK